MYGFNVLKLVPMPKVSWKLFFLTSDFFFSARKEEVGALSGPNEFAEFYSRLKGLKDFHKKHPNEVSFKTCCCKYMYNLIKQLSI